MDKPPLKKAFTRSGSSGQADLQERFEQLYIAVEQSPVATAITDTNGHLEFVNQRFLDVTGYAREELLGRTPAVIQSGETPDAVYDDLWSTLQAGRIWEGELLNRRKSGELYREVQTITPVKNTRGDIVSYVTVKEDVTRRRAQERELRLMAAAFDTGQATLITDTNMVIRRVNQAFTDITGYQSHEVIGQTPRLFKSGRHDDTFYQRLWQTLVDTGHWQGEIWNRNKYGDIYPLWQSISAVPDADGQVCHYVSVFHDIAERKRMEEKLETQAMNDHLTGAYNRRAFDAALARCVNETQPFSLLLFDIDHFKQVNDTHGHDRGDLILQQLAQCLSGCLRASDLLARWGGEEFAVLLHGTGHQGAWVLAERILHNVRGQTFFGHRITVSIGVAEYQPDETHESLINRVDQALYAAKHRGRDTAVASEPASV